MKCNDFQIECCFDNSGCYYLMNIDKLSKFNYFFPFYSIKNQLISFSATNFYFTIHSSNSNLFIYFLSLTLTLLNSSWFKALGLKFFTFLLTR